MMLRRWCRSQSSDAGVLATRLCVGMLCLLALASWQACETEAPPAATEASGGSDAGSTPDAVVLTLDPELESPPPVVLRRLTTTQYRNTLAGWFGEDLVLPASLEPDVRSDGLFAVGASVNGVSLVGVERYFNGAKNVASQLVEVATLRDRVVTCDGAEEDESCLRAVVETWCLRLWRRPPTEVEVERVMGVAQEAIDSLGGFDEGLRYALTTILSSPKFLYVVGSGEGSAEVPRPYTSWEMASRLA